MNKTPKDRILSNDSLLFLAHSLVFSFLYTVYGQHICPILDGKDFAVVMIPATAALAAQYAIRTFVSHTQNTGTIGTNIRGAFWLDYGLFFISGLAVAVFNRYQFNLPWENFTKVSLSFIALGFYISLDLSLARERRLAKQVIEGKIQIPLDDKALPVTQKFLLFSIINLLVLSTVFLLVVYKDILHAQGSLADKAAIQIAIMVEVAFVVLVFASYISRVIFQYSKIIKLCIETESQALFAVAKGQLESKAPIVSNDEFGQMASLTNKMIGQLKANLAELERTRDASIVALVSLAARRDNETGQHLRRTQCYIRTLAKELQNHSDCKETISNDYIELIFKSAPLHDIGKVGIPDAILQKPGKLTKAEFEIMKTHATIGSEALLDAQKQIGESSFLSLAEEIARTHHEKWDGTGYPEQLAGKHIPLSGRLMAVADVYDALRSKRVYKPAMSHIQALTTITDGSGSHFDPMVVDAFLKMEKTFERTALKMADDETASHDGSLNKQAA